MRTLGYYKFRGERVVGMLQRIVSLFTLIGVMRVAEWSLWWLALLIPAFLVVWFIDKHFLYGGESGASLRENPEWQAIREDIQQIKERA